MKKMNSYVVWTLSICLVSLFSCNSESKIAQSSTSSADKHSLEVHPSNVPLKDDVGAEYDEYKMDLSEEMELEDVVVQHKRIRKQLKAQPNALTTLSPQATQVHTGTNLSYEEPIIEYNTEEYAHIQENTFQSPKTHPLSTFSIDVDAASYANMRRFIEHNQTPYPDAVRIEELVNYFDYNYSTPTGEDPFSITTELSSCPWNDQHQLIHIGLQGKEIALEETPPSNLVFLLDVSGSMNDPDKLPLLKKAFRLLVKELKPEDKVAIVVYAGAAGEVLSSTPASNSEKIIQALEKLEAGGSTAGGAGIQLAYRIARENLIEEGNNRVILATDGDFNVGASSDGELVRMIEEKRKEGIFLSILGFGTGNYKDAKMEAITNKGNGNYSYIDNILEAKKVLVNEMGGTLYTIAKDVKIQIEFNPAVVKGYRLLGYENRLMKAEDFDNDQKDAGELGSGHTVTALYEIVPKTASTEVPEIGDLKYQQALAKNTSSKNELMTVKFRYKQPDMDESKLIVQTQDNHPISLDNTSDNYRFSASVASFGMILRNSEFMGESSFKLVKELAQSAVGQDIHGYRSEFIRLVEKAELLFDPGISLKK